MNQEGLPNSGCVLLVRGEDEKKRISSKLNEKGRSFVETIVKFMTRKRNVLFGILLQVRRTIHYITVKEDSAFKLANKLQLLLN